MNIEKRDGTKQLYDRNKIENAIKQAFHGLHIEITTQQLNDLSQQLDSYIYEGIHVENIQDLVEELLMKEGHLQVAKAYILYRHKHTESRLQVFELLKILKDFDLENILIGIQHDYPDECYSLSLLLMKMKTFYKEQMTKRDLLKTLMKASEELISKDAPGWEMITTRFLSYDISKQVLLKMNE